MDWRPRGAPHQAGSLQSTQTCYVESSLASEFPREVVFERELQLESVALEAVREVLAPAPLELTAEHHVRRRVMEQVPQHVVAAVERVRRLRVAVVDVLHRITECA